MRSVTDIADEIIAREGGFVDDPDDPGGATNFGVTIHTMRRLGLDLDRDGDVDVADVRRLTKRQARDIFVDHYFRRPGIARLPEALQPSVFDMYVNAGANAVRILQRLLADFGQTVTADGVIGPGRSRRSRPPSPPRPPISPTPTGSRGATTTTRSPTAAPPRASTPAGGTAGRAAGSCGPRSSSPPAGT
jgi:hypothetical protein